eukprot:m.51562 g.51562  ORF g.51562 m.51562 type:complete len:162 (-) comp48323_c1_seq8:58-543(-)
MCLSFCVSVYRSVSVCLAVCVCVSCRTCELVYSAQRLEGEYADAAEQFRRTEQQLNDRLRRQHEIFQLEQQVMQTDYEVVRDGFVKVEDNSSFTWLPLSIVRRFTEHTVADGSILSLPVDLEPLAAIVDYLRDNRMTSALRHCTDARRVWAELGIQEAFPL